MTFARKGASLLQKAGVTYDAEYVSGRIGGSWRGKEFGAAPTALGSFSGSRSQRCGAGLTFRGGPPGLPRAAKGSGLTNMKHYNIEVNSLAASMVSG